MAVVQKKRAFTNSKLSGMIMRLTKQVNEQNKKIQDQHERIQRFNSIDGIRTKTILDDVAKKIKKQHLDNCLVEFNKLTSLNAMLDAIEIRNGTQDSYRYWTWAHQVRHAANIPQDVKYEALEKAAKIEEQLWKYSKIKNVSIEALTEAVRSYGVGLFLRIDKLEYIYIRKSIFKPRISFKAKTYRGNRYSYSTSSTSYRGRNRPSYGFGRGRGRGRDRGFPSSQRRNPFTDRL